MTANARQRLLTVAKVAERLQMTTDGVYKLIQRGKLEAVRLSERKTRVVEESLERYVEASQAWVDRYLAAKPHVDPQTARTTIHRRDRYDPGGLACGLEARRVRRHRGEHGGSSEPPPCAARGMRSRSTIRTLSRWRLPPPQNAADHRARRCCLPLRRSSRTSRDRATWFRPHPRPGSSSLRELRATRPSRPPPKLPKQRHTAPRTRCWAHKLSEVAAGQNRSAGLLVPWRASRTSDLIAPAA